MTSILTNKHVVLDSRACAHTGGALGGDVLHAAEPGGWGYPGGTQMSQVLSCDMTHAKTADVSIAVCHPLVPSAHRFCVPENQ